jgi:hypothetical protein
VCNRQLVEVAQEGEGVEVAVEDGRVALGVHAAVEVVEALVVHAVAVVGVAVGVGVVVVVVVVVVVEVVVVMVVLVVVEREREERAIMRVKVM